MSIVVGTAGHIDHGKTALLRALTGIDADRLPEERRRGMTIDVGYAHLTLRDGRVIDFVDVPGHDRLIGNMLVGAGEIDAALLVVAADEGPNAQTLEHLGLLDAIGITAGLAVITKADLLPDQEARDRRRDEVGALLASTWLAGSPVLLASARTGEGLDAVRDALADLVDRTRAGTSEADAASEPDAVRGGDRIAAAPSRPEGSIAGSGRPRLAIDRAFLVRGRGAVVTGSLRAGRLRMGQSVRIEPGGLAARIRELQVRGTTVTVAGPGRTALNLAGIDVAELRRGQVVTVDPAVEVGDHWLVTLQPPAVFPAHGAPARSGRAGSAPARRWPPVGTELRLHLGTDQATAVLDRPGILRFADELQGRTAGDAAVVARVRLDRPMAAAAGDHFALRLPSPSTTVAGGVVLDPRPPTGTSRRRVTPARVEVLLAAIETVAGVDPRPAVAAALLDLHGAMSRERWEAIGGLGAPGVGSLALAPDVLDGLAADALAAVAGHHAADPDSAGIPVDRLRRAVATSLRRRARVTAVDAGSAAAALIGGLVRAGRLASTADRVRDPGRAQARPPALEAAMDRLEALLAVPAPPPFDTAVAASGCPPEGVRALETSGRIIRLGPDLAYAAWTYRELEALALRLAADGPVTPAAFRDATATSRRFSLAMLEDLDRRGILRRTADGHIPGPRAPQDSSGGGS